MCYVTTFCSRDWNFLRFQIKLKAKIKVNDFFKMFYDALFKDLLIDFMIEKENRHIYLFWSLMISASINQMIDINKCVLLWYWHNLEQKIRFFMNEFQILRKENLNKW
jgi:hypothetical protein